MKDTYVAATHKAIAANVAPDTIISGLQTVMQERGHLRLLPSVLKTVLRTLEASQSIRTVVRTATLADQETYQSAIADVLKTMDANTTPMYEHDETLIGGYQVEATGKRFDASYKQQLHTLYQSITT